MEEDFEQKIIELEKMLNQLKTDFVNHRHNKVDNIGVKFTDIAFTKESAITAPTGGTTVDAEARTAINSIISTLQTLNLTN